MTSPFTSSVNRRCSGGDREFSRGCETLGSCGIDSLRGGKEGRFTTEASGDGMDCIVLPLRSGLRLFRVRFSGDDGISKGFEFCRRRPMTVPSRLRPPNAERRCSGAIRSSACNVLGWRVGRTWAKSGSPSAS